MTYKLTPEQTEEVKHLGDEIDQISSDVKSLQADYDNKENALVTPLRAAQRALFLARSKLSSFIDGIRYSHRNDLGTDPLEPDTEDLELYAKYFAYDNEPAKEIRNKTGLMEVRSWQNDGVWIVLDDGRESCSIGLNHDEIEHLIDIINEMRYSKIIF